MNSVVTYCLKFSYVSFSTLLMTTLFYLNSPDNDWQEFPDWADWYEFPAWANFFIELGEFVALEPFFDERIVVAMAIPKTAKLRLFQLKKKIPTISICRLKFLPVRVLRKISFC